MALNDLLTLGKKSTTAVLQAYLEVTLKDTDKGNSFQLAETQAVYLTVRFAWKDIWPEVWIITYSWVVTNGLAGWSENLKEKDWRISDKEVWVRGFCMNLSEWAPSVRMFVSHVNIH